MYYLIKRGIALYIDGVIIALITLFSYLVWNISIGIKLFEIENPDSNVLLVFHLTVTISYFIIFDLLLNRTLGKIFLKLKIEGLRKKLCLQKFFQVLARNICRFIPFEPFSIFLNEERKMWHDLFSKTQVIDVRKSMKK